MDDDMKEVLIHGEKDEEIRFTLTFKWVLAISIGLTGILSVAGTIYLVSGAFDKIWITSGINNFLYKVLLYISILLCFISLVNIAIIRRPFSRILVWCTMAIGILFTISSVIFPRIKGYNISGFYILSNGEVTLIDGTLLMLGALGILFSKVIKYGFMYQKNTDMTV